MTLYYSNILRFDSCTTAAIKSQFPQKQNYMLSLSADVQKWLHVLTEGFETKIKELKAKSKTKDWEVSVYVDDKFYTAAKNWLQKHANENGMNKWRTATMQRKGWKIRKDVVISKTNRKIVPFSKLYDALHEANMHVAHRCRDEMDFFICTIVFWWLKIK